MTGAHRQFEGLLSGYFEPYLNETPIYATIYAGWREAEGKLGSAGLSYHEKREQARHKALRALDRISPRQLTPEQMLDSLALRNLLLRECEDFARGRHTLEPAAPGQLMEILLHELMRGGEEPRRAAANLRSLLRQAPDYLDEAATAVDKPEPVWRHVMEETVQGAPSLLAGLGRFLGEVSPNPEDAPAIRRTQKAIEKFRDRVMNRTLALEGSFAAGAPAVQRRVRDELALDYSLGQVEALAQSEIERVHGLLRQACAPFGRRRLPEEIIAKAQAEWRPAKPLLELYREETRRVADAFRDADAMTFPKGDRLEIKPVPDFLRPIIATAAYNPPPAFEKRQRGTFWVKDPAEPGKDPAEIFKQEQEHFGISLTCAHEAYPGHHLQFVMSNRHPRKWRRLFSHAVFYEGWTLWCEQMTVDLNVEASPHLRVRHLYDALWRCHRILVDLRLQTGRYSHAQAMGHLRRHLGFSRARAEAEANWYTTQPCVPMSYWLGRLENDRLRKRLMEGRGWTLRQFNDWLLSFGTLPQAWIEKYGME